MSVQKTTPEKSLVSKTCKHEYLAVSSCFRDIFLKENVYIFNPKLPSGVVKLYSHFREDSRYNSFRESGVSNYTIQRSLEGPGRVQALDLI